MAAAVIGKPRSLRAWEWLRPAFGKLSNTYRKNPVRYKFYRYSCGRAGINGSKRFGAWPIDAARGRAQVFWIRQGPRVSVRVCV